MKKNKGFTLIELLVVIAIISLLLSIIMPSLQKVKELAKKVICSSNLSQTGKALEMYEMDYNYKRFVMREDVDDMDGYWWAKLAPYFGDDNFESNLKEGSSIDVLMCASAPASKFDESSQVETSSGIGTFGTYNRPWEWTRTDGLSTLGSLCMNGWIGYDYMYDNSSDRSEYMYRKWLNIAGNVPVFADGIWSAAWPMGDDDAPSDLTGESSNIENESQMSRFCVARHGKENNIVFKDLHTESSKLEDLWYYRWHKDYEVPASAPDLP